MTLAGMRPTSLNTILYLTAQATTVRQRLKMAGVRLAAILNTALVAP